MSDSTLVPQIGSLGLLRQDIDKRMAEYFQSGQAGLGISMSPEGKQAVRLLEEFSCRPGKRIRGALAVIGYEMFGGTKRQNALDLAVAIELVQNYLLIVDDVMDRSLSRRGGATVHQQYLHTLTKKYADKDVEHLSNMLAINVGLIAQHMASHILSGIQEDAERLVRLQALFHKNIAATGYGQIDDLFNDAGNRPDEAAIRRIYALKSSHYTFINPLQAGACLAGARDEDLEGFYEFGLHAGVAFQLKDDIIGMFGEEADTGKSTLDDLREGKVTLLMLHVLAHASVSDKQIVQAALGNDRVTQEDHEAVKAILRSCGSLSYVEDEARNEAAAAIAALKGQPTWPQPYMTFLEDLMHYILERNR